jgi:hypothetical protein
MLSTSSSLCISKSPCPSLLCASQPALPLVQGTARSTPSSIWSPSLPFPVPVSRSPTSASRHPGLLLHNQVEREQPPRAAASPSSPPPSLSLCMSPSLSVSVQFRPAPSSPLTLSSPPHLPRCSLLPPWLRTSLIRPSFVQEHAEETVAENLRP